MAEALDAGIALQRELGYWEARRHMLYYKSLFQFVSVVGYDAKTIIDVGSSSTGYVNWMSWIPDRTVLDLEIPVKPPGVTAIEQDFLTFEPPRKYDVAMCCQVLEHIEDPKPFCDKLKEICRRLVISVPYKWGGATPGHIHDPVDEAKLAGWMGRKPNSMQIVSEPFRESRLIAYYDMEGGPKTRFDKHFIFEAIADRAPFIKA